MFRVTKTYGHHLGLSTTFSQWRADSHCRFLHGYSLAVELVFQAPKLNRNNWVVDFGSLKTVKKWLEETFDHKTLVAHDDPALRFFQDGAKEYLGDPQRQILDIIIVPKTGCEGFAEYIYTNVHMLLNQAAVAGLMQGGADNGAFLESVEVREHGANSATYTPQYPVTFLGEAVNYVRG
jgi:6-pyruvoyltetrahydropterin/6-carboxytetrahydropterin synthase